MANRKLLTGIFLFSFSSLSYEIALTRIFSISLWYHFAFMVISIAMLGIGAGGALLSLYPKLKDISRIGTYGLFLGAGISVSYTASNQIPFDPVRLSWDRVQLLYICIYYIVLSVPFFFFGLCIAVALSGASEKSGLLYGADLLGAGMGSIGLLCLMNFIGAEKVVIISSSIALTGAFVTGGRKIRAASVLLVMLNSLLIFTDTINPRMSPYKGLQLALRYPGAEHLKTFNSPFSRVDVFKSPAVRFAPGLSLTYLDNLPEQIGLTIDGGETNAITRTGNQESLRFLRYLPSALPYEIGRIDNVLVLEPKGGLDVLLSRYFGSGNIYKVDSNPLVIRVVRDKLEDISQGIYSKDTWHGMGRSWLKKRGAIFDIIALSLTGTAPSGTFGIAEDYRFTVEAFKEYLIHLNENGMLSINLFIIPPPRTELRLFSTLIESMEGIGIWDISSRIIAIRSWGTICILVKKSPFTPEEIEGAKRFAKSRRFDLVYLPGIKEEETNIFVKMPSNEYSLAFMKILNPGTRTAFQNDYIFNIRPVHDENPFFHYYLKLKNIKVIYAVMGARWQYFIEEGYLLPLVFVQVLLLSIVFILLPAFSKRRKNNNLTTPHSIPPLVRGDTEGSEGGEGVFKHLLYFAFLGLGFMFVEVSIIQKMILPLENPSYSFAVVLTTVLISSGLGSLLSHRVSMMRNRYVLFLISMLIAAYSLFVPAISDIVSPYPIPVRVAFIFVVLLPLGLLMGIPFPLGLSLLGRGNPNLIPWAWAINGCFSVFSPILTIMVAMAAGFKAVLLIGSTAYFLAFFAFPVSSFESQIKR